MPAREPTYYRWAEDKPCTTNQTYGYDLRHQVGGNSGNSSTTCKLCIAEAATAAAKRQADQQQRQMAATRRDAGQQAGCCPHGELHCKPINKGYTMGPLPVTKRLQSFSRCCAGRRQKTAGGATSSASDEDLQSGGRDLYLWHALAGTIVHCKNENSDE